MSKPSKPASPNQRHAWQSVLPGLLLVAMVLLAYSRVWNFAFVWDDDSNVINSRALRTLDGLRRIWFEPGATQQYYPITHSSFWLDYHVWGLNPAGYHVENVLLHALSAVLLWQLLRRLGVKGAWLGAALFALHPINVESVAWVTERKNSLSGVFFMGSLLASVGFWRLAKPAVMTANASSVVASPEPVYGPLKFYFLALGLYLCALWSKTATVGLPAVIWLLIWWKRGWPKMKEVLLLVPFVALGVGTGLVTMWVEKHHVGATDAVWGGLARVERIFVAGRAFWFYLGKLAWPHPLMFMYPRWTIRATDVINYLAILATVAGFVILWRKREGWARPWLVAVGFFAIVLFPVIGFFNQIFFMYSFVCDHFPYLACIGPLALAAAGITLAVEGFGKGLPLLKPAVYGTLLVTLGVLTWQQTGIFHDMESLWRDTLDHNPNSWMARENFGSFLCKEGRFEEGDEQFREAIQIHPDDYMAYNNLGLGLARKGQLDEAIQDFNRALEIKPDYAIAHYDIGRALVSQGKVDEGIGHLRRAAQVDSEFPAGHFALGLALEQNKDLSGALTEFSKTAELWPNFAPAEAAMGDALAGMGRIDEAIDHYHKSLELDPASVGALANMGNALVAKGRFDDAIAAYRGALQLQPNIPVLHYKLGLALERDGKHDEAEAEIAEANRLKSAGAGSRPATGMP
jgi:tetratricopeptide (TPR) repeat protein